MEIAPITNSEDQRFGSHHEPDDRQFPDVLNEPGDSFTLSYGNHCPACRQFLGIVGPSAVQ